MCLLSSADYQPLSPPIPLSSGLKSGAALGLLRCCWDWWSGWVLLCVYEHDDALRPTITWLQFRRSQHWKTKHHKHSTVKVLGWWDVIAHGSALSVERIQCPTGIDPG